MKYILHCSIFPKLNLCVLVAVQARGQYSFVLTIPGPGARQPGTTSIAQNPLKIFKLANPTLFTLPCPAFPLEMLIKAVTLTFPSLLSPAYWPSHGFPTWLGWRAGPPIPRTCEDNKLFCPEPFFCLFLGLHLTDHLKRIQNNAVLQKQVLMLACLPRFLLSHYF